MPTDNRSREEILSENEKLCFRVEEAEETLQAIYSGEVDAFVVYMPEGAKVFTLQGAEHPYRVLVETMNEGAAFLAIGGMIVYCNRQLSDMLQVPMEKLTGSLLGAYMTSQDQALLADWLEKPAHQDHRHEITLKTATGNRLPVLFSCTTVEISGKPGAGVVVTDISEYKVYQAAIAESRNLLSTIIDTAPVRVFWKDRNLRYLGCNRAFAQDAGLEGPDDVIGKDDHQMPWADLAELYRTDDRLVMDSGLDKLCYEEPVTLANISDRQIWIQTSKVPLRNKNNEIFGMLGTYEDITERKIAKDRIDHLTREQQAMLDNELVGILKLRGRHIIWKNKAMERIFGYRSGELDGQLIRILFPDDASYQVNGDSVYPILNARGTYRTQLEMIRKNGEKLWMDISAAKLSGSDDESLWVLADITPIKKHQDKIEHIAYHDHLTGLPNRLLVADRLNQALAQAKRSGQMLAVCYLDLDGFKPVNDSFGHAAGDKLLIEIAHRLKASVRGKDTVGRLGGDEFVLLLTDLENVDEYQLALQRIMEAINQPVAIEETHEVKVTSSIGIALFPQDSTVPDTLLRHADHAMYVAKQSGRNRYCRFDANQDAAMKTGQVNLAGIRRALDRHEFVLHYQPEVNMKTGAVMGVEALIRWQHPKHGLLLPASFIPIVKNNPYGIELGEWVIDTAFAQLAQWHGQGFDIPISVNIDAQHLQSDGFALRLSERFAAHTAVRPGQFELEVLEPSALEDVDNASKVMQACCEIGIHFALDDFGTGYSSLVYLKRLPVDILKIDQSLIRDMLNDPEDLSIVEGMIGLAKSFHLQVIAEGVETAGQGERLLALGCDLAQGYAIAKPMPGAELPGWVAAWQQNSVWTASNTIANMGF